MPINTILMSKPSNPNGANQYQYDPRQLVCWKYYVDPKSETFGNATQSAIKAGYEPDYADQITTVEWFKGKLRKLNFVDKAERNLDDALEGGLDDPEKGAKIIKWKATEFSLKTLGKEEGYNEFNPGESFSEEEKTKLLSLLDDKTSSN